MTEHTQRRIAFYRRSASEEPEAMTAQLEMLNRHLQEMAGFALVEDYADAGISSLTPLRQRPAGARLLAAAARQKFDEVWFTGLSRLSRQNRELLDSAEVFDGLGIDLNFLDEYLDESPRQTE